MTLPVVQQAEEWWDTASCLKIAELSCNTASYHCSLHFQCISLPCDNLQHAKLIAVFQWLHACNEAGPFYPTFHFQLFWFFFFTWTLQLWRSACMEIDIYRGREEQEKGKGGVPARRNTLQLNGSCLNSPRRAIIYLFDLICGWKASGSQIFSNRASATKFMFSKLQGTLNWHFNYASDMCLPRYKQFIEL